MKVPIKKIRTKLLLSYGVLLIVVCIIFLVLYYVSKHTIQTAMINNSCYTAEVMAEKLNSEIEYLLMVRAQIYSDSNINAHINGLLSCSDFWDFHYLYSKLNTAMNGLTQILIQDNKNSEIIIFSPSCGLLYYSWTTLNISTPPTLNISQQIESDLDSLFGDSSHQRISCERIRNSYNPNNPNESYLYFYRPHTNPYSGVSDYYIIIGISQENMKQYMLPPGNTGTGVVYINSDQNVIFSNLETPADLPDLLSFTDPEQINYRLISYCGETYIQLNTPISAVNWTQIQLIPVLEILRELNHWSFILTIALGCLAVGMLTGCLYLNRSIIHPIRQLDHDIQLVKGGSIDLHPSEIPTSDEIGRLCTEFYDMIHKLHILQQQMLLKEKQKRDLEIEALQAQINPHFMYNTIGSIKMLLRLGRIDQAISSLTALVDILKSTIAHSDETVSLKEEVHILKSYIYIQQRRYSEFQFEVDLPKNLENYHIMRFLIQPFLENSLLHGYAEIDQSTNLSVVFCGDIPHSVLTVEIKDNGCGMSEETLQRILNHPKESRALNGIGIFNVVERIRLNYGAPYSAQFHSAIGHGTTVTLTLPLLQNKREDPPYEPNDQASDCR